jgi:putative FmdB family regulatory protein
MPTYEYGCEACGHEWEETQRITEPPIEVCPVCAKPSAHRLISAGTNFILKGGGWYSDLYTSPKQPADSAKKGETGDKGEKGEKAEKADKKADASAEKTDKAATKPASTQSPAGSPSTT